MAVTGVKVSLWPHKLVDAFQAVVYWIWDTSAIFNSAGPFEETVRGFFAKNKFDRAHESVFWMEVSTVFWWPSYLGAKRFFPYFP